VSGVIGLQPGASGGSYGPQVVHVGGDHEVAAAQRALDDAGVDDVGGPGAGGQGACLTRLRVVERLDVAAVEQPGQQNLVGGAAPRLGHA
jgi:hypothetical protein